MSEVQLYKASVLSGLKNMSWTEFSGVTIGVSDNNKVTEDSQTSPGYSGVGAFHSKRGVGEALTATTGIQYIPTVGSVAVLNFGEVIQLTEDYYAPGSLGSFNLQLTVTVENNEYESYEANKYELVIIPMNSGIWVNERGTSSIYIGLLAKADVLNTSTGQEHYSHSTIKRMVGGSLINNLRSAMGWISSKLPFVKNALNKIDHPYARVGHDVLNSLVYGMSAAGASGGLQNRLM